MLEQIHFHDVPLNGVDAMTASTARTFPRHTHDQYGIGVVDCGGHASLSDRRQVEAGPGSLIFVNPGEVHDGRAIGRSRSWRMLYFDQSTMETTQADIRDGSTTPLVFAAPVLVNEKLRRCFDAAFSQAAATAAWRDAMACETAMVRLAACAQVNATTRPRRLQEPIACIARARDWIDADPSAPLTLARLAGEVGLSRYQLLRGFARDTGLTPHAYILQRRLALARRRIRAGQALADAAIISGFCDQSHLTRCFVRQFGVTPSRYARHGH